jgi:MFS family permease
MPYHAKSGMHLKPTFEIVVTRMIFTLGVAITTVGVPLYLVELGASDSQVGIYIGAMSLLIGALTLFLPPILEKFNQLKILIISYILTGFGLFAFGYTRYVFQAIFLLFVVHFFVTVGADSLGILFKDSTRGKKEFTRDTGLMGSLINFSWFIGPLIGGLMLNYAGVKGLFIMSGLFCLLAAIFILLLPFKTVNKKRPEIDSSLKENLFFYLARPKLRIAYIQNMSISVWWGFIWTFVPIFMVKQGYSVASIGIFIGLTQLPLFLLEFITVKILNKYSYRTVFFSSYAILGLIGIFAYLTPIYSAGLVAILLGSFALSFIEPVSQLYFFDQVTKLEEEKTYPVYGTSNIVGGTVVRLIIGAGLALFADRAAFLILALLMLYTAYNALKISPANKLT